MADRIGVVVVGLGESGRWLHCRPLSRLPEYYELKGVFDAMPAAREAVAGEYSVQAYRSFDDVLADKDVRLVVVATPTRYHKELAIAAVQAGKHAVVEKPMAMNAEEALAMIEAAERAGVILTVHKNRRWYAEFRTARKIIENGLLGRVFSIEKRNGWPPPAGGEHETWRSHKEMGGGVLNEMGSHHVDQILLLVPSPVERVLCTTKNVFTRETEDFYRLSLWFADGTIAQMETYQTAYLPQAMWYVMGEQGTLISEHDNNWGKMTLVRWADGLRMTMHPDPLEGGTEEAGRFFYTALANSIQDGTELAVKPREVLRVMQVLDAARQSAASGEVVHMRI